MVLDASMALAWHFADEVTPKSQAVSAMCDERAVIVPTHWFLEIANGLLVGERKGRSTLADSARFLERIGTLDVIVEELDAGSDVPNILALARAHRLTAYDTLYLELAGRRGRPLASLDVELCAAARDVGIDVVTDAL